MGALLNELHNAAHCGAIGFLASGLVLAAFGMKDMLKLRIVAICSNFAFIAYGITLSLPPVWLLHLILLPLNCWRLAQEWRSVQPPLQFGSFHFASLVARIPRRPRGA